MILTLLYSLWIAYTVGSLSILFGLFSLWLVARWENKRFRKALDERMKNITTIPGEDW